MTCVSQRTIRRSYFFFFSCLDKMALDTVYDWRSTAPQDIKCFPSYLTYHSQQGIQSGNGKGGKEAAATKRHLFGSNIPKSVSTSLKSSGCQLVHFDREESLPRLNGSPYVGKFWGALQRGKGQYPRTSTPWIWAWCSIWLHLIQDISSNALHILGWEKNQLKG